MTERDYTEQRLDSHDASVIDVAAVFSSFLIEYEKDPNYALELAARILLSECQLQMRIDVVSTALVEDPEACDVQGVSDDDIREWALKIGEMGIWNAIDDGGITPARFNAVLCHPLGLRVAGEELQRPVEFGEDSPRAAPATQLERSVTQPARQPQSSDTPEYAPQSVHSEDETEIGDGAAAIDSNRYMATPASLKVPASDAPSRRWSLSHTLPALAASLLAAISISWSMWLGSQNTSLRNTNASLRARIDRQAELSQKVTSLTKESLGRTVADSTPLYLSGDTTPNLVRQALLAATISSRSAALNGDEKADLERSRMLFEEAISLRQLEDPSKRNIVEKVTAAIWSGDLDRAEELVQSTELTPDDPAVINLKGVLAMYESEYREDARPDLQKEAESIFGEAAGKGELIAWINLAVVLKRQGRNDEAVKALKMYIENASADLADVVREFLPDTTSLP